MLEKKDTIPKRIKLITTQIEIHSDPENGMPAFARFTSTLNKSFLGISLCGMVIFSLAIFTPSAQTSLP
jgi:hypothetical protein